MKRTILLLGLIACLPLHPQQITRSVVIFSPRGVGAGLTGEARFYELTAGGENYVGLKAPDALAANTPYTLPVAYPAANGYALTSTTAGVTSWTDPATFGVNCGSGFTAGSVIFSNGTVCAQDNANLFWNDGGNKLSVANVEVKAGVDTNGGGLKHQTVSTGSIGAGAYTAVSLIWSTTFGDASYNAVCSVIESTSGAATLRVDHIETVAASTLTVGVVNQDLANPHTGTLYCIALHV